MLFIEKMGKWPCNLLGLFSLIACRRQLFFFFFFFFLAATTLIDQNDPDLALAAAEVEVKVREATNNQPWGTAGRLNAEIAEATYNYEEYNQVMGIIWKRLNSNGKEWRQVYKGIPSPCGMLFWPTGGVYGCRCRMIRSVFRGTHIPPTPFIPPTLGARARSTAAA